MCGFTAYFSNGSIGRHHIEALEQSNKDMLHRGPDEQDVWYHERVALAHVRLSIIGVSNGHQPIFNEGRTVALVCNGEIYNYRQLRRQLQGRGHHFVTESDSEVIVHLYEEYGERLCAHLDGMFAFCLYDTQTGTLLLARDLAGKKPLYYAHTPDGIVFSSELEVIRKHFLTNPRANFEVIRQTQRHSYSIDPEETYVSGIRKVPYGSSVTVRPGERQLQFKRYCQRKIEAVFTGTYTDACAEVRRLLVRAVEKRLQSEVPVAVLLSAGVDSSAIATIARGLTDDVHVISAGYSGTHDVDERAAAKRLSNDRGFKWHEIELRESDFPSSLEEILSRLDEPNGDVAMFAQWEIYRQAREQGFKVLLSGNGGDELFFGYSSHNDYARALAWGEDAFSPDFSFRKTTGMFLQQLRARLLHSDKFVLEKMFPQTLPVMRELERMEPHGRPELHRADWHRIDLPNTIDRVYHFLHYAWLANNCYFLADKLAMAHSVEVRSPFADRDLMNFVDSLPLSMRFRNGRPKQLLKDSLSDLLPKYVLNRQKTGFTPPTAFITKLVNSYSPRYFRESPQNLAQLVTDQFVARL